MQGPSHRQRVVVSICYNNLKTNLASAQPKNRGDFKNCQLNYLTRTIKFKISMKKTHSVVEMKILAKKIK